jgi:hypothetical protein
MDTFRVGWTPPARRAASNGGARPGSPASPPSTGKPARKGKRGKALAGGPIKQPELLKKREQLSKEFAELQWDLGGIAYEMANRKRFNREVLTKQAERLRAVDAELAQIERVLRMDEGAAAGTCASCGAVQARGAVFCWQCGKQLQAEASPKPNKATKKK